MIDGDLLTAYKPGSNKAGYITYTLSDKLDVKKFNIIQKGVISNAKVYALIDKEVTTRNIPEEDKEWIQLGTLRKSLNEFYVPRGNVYKLKFEWEENHIPAISEIITLTDDEYKSEYAKDLRNYIDSLHVDEDKYTATSYKAYSTARTKVLEVYNTQMGEKDALETAKADLKASYDALVVRGNTAELDLLLDQAKKIDSKLYTEKSYKNLLDVIEATEKALDNKNELTQEEVDALTADLRKAMEALEKLPVITPSIPEEKPTTPSKPEETTKPAVKPSTKPATGDTTMLGVFAFFSMISLLGYVLLKKKEA